MAAMESLRLALNSFPALVASAPPSKVDRQLREIAAALAALLSPEESDAMLPEQQAVQEDAVHLLLDIFCRAHAQDHMSDFTKLGSWRLPYVAMLHSYASLHLPLVRQLELLLHSSRASLGPVQCSALSTFMLFMNPYQILQRNVTGELDDPSAEIVSNSPHQELKSNMKEKQVGNCRVKALFEWRWEACLRASELTLDCKEQEQDGYNTRQVQGETLDFENKAEESMNSPFTENAEAGNHWMDQFCDAFAMDSESNILWAARFAASYLRNVAVYWEHIVFKDCRESWHLTDLALQLKNTTLVGPIFAAFVPQNMVIFLIWLHQRLDFAFHFDQSPEIASLKKALALCEIVLASPLGVLLRSTKVCVSLSKFFAMELRTGWKEWILSKSRRQFLRFVVWGGAITEAHEHFSWGLLWKDYGGDRTRACIAITTVFLTSQCQQKVESRCVEGQLDTRVGRNDDDGMPKSSWTGTKKQCIRADTPDLQNLPQFLWLKESEANPADVDILQIILELASNLDLQCEPWFLEVAFDCLNNQARLENAVFMHCDTCTHAHKCKSKHYNLGVCSAYRLKSCIAALPASQIMSHERSYKLEKVFKFCWLGDGPFSIDFAGQLLSSFHISKTASTFLKAENQWNVLLLATWVRFFNVVGPPILDLHYMVGGVDLGSVLSHLHTIQQFLVSNSKNICPDIDGFKVAAMAMPQLAAITLIEALFTASSCSDLVVRERFLANLALEASQLQHEASSRVLEILRLTGRPGLQASYIDNEDKTTVSEDAARFILKSLLFYLVDMASMAAISTPDLIIKKWTAFEYKRRWISDYKSTGPISVARSHLEGSKSKHLSLASLELEFDERIGKPQKSTWDILLEWVITLINLYPDSIRHLLTNITHHRKLACAEAEGIIASGLQALTLSLVVAGLPKETVASLAQSNTTRADWTLLLSQMRMGLEKGFRRLFLSSQKSISCDLSAMKVEMDFFLLELQGVTKATL